MPNVFELRGYSIYFWSNEAGEPVHVHVSRRGRSEHATKIWITSSGGAVVAHNMSKIPIKDLNKIVETTADLHELIETRWIQKFKHIEYYC